MRQPGAKVEDVFKQVRAHVRRDSQGKQIPWEATSLEGDFYFQGGKPTASVARDTTTNRYGYTVGDRWRFQTIDRQKGEVVSNWGLSVDYIEADGSMLLNRGTTRLDAAGRIKYVKNADGRERTYPTTNLRWFPDMKKGEQRAISFATEDKRASGATYHVDNQALMRVFDFEKIKTPAGEFQAQRIELKGTYKSQRDDGKSGEGTFFTKYWYVPSLRYYVVAEYENTDWNGKQERSVRDELTSFEVVNPPAARR
jgi:hypothetical protein